MEEEVSTVEIDGVLYEKHEDREGVITFTPVESKTHTLEFTEHELIVGGMRWLQDKAPWIVLGLYLAIFIYIGLSW